MNKHLNCHIKVKDQVKVITGEYRGLIGTIDSINSKKSVLFIKEITPRIKYLKKTKDEESKKIEVQIPIHISNVMLWDQENKVASKIGYKIIDTKKYRFFKKSGKNFL